MKKILRFYAFMALTMVMFTQCDLIKGELSGSKEVNKSVIILPVDTIQTNTITQVEAIEQLETNYDEFQSTFKSKPSYKVIIGSFKTYDYAAAFAEKYGAELMEIDENGFYKVSLERFNEKTQAIEYLNGIQLKDSTWWVFYDIQG